MDKINNLLNFVGPFKKQNKKVGKNNKRVKNSSKKNTNEIDQVLDFENVLLEDIVKNENNSLETLFKTVTMQGEKFKRNPTMFELMKYKSHVKNFINQVLKKMTAIEKVVTGFYPKEVVKINIKIIDEKLKQLAEAFHRNEKDNFKLVSIIDSIEGILIDLKG